MSKYLDICIQAIPKKHVAEYRKGTKMVGKILIKHGALSSSDYVADDKNATSGFFPKTMKVKKDEVVIVALAEFNSKAHRESVFKKMMKDPKMENMNTEPSKNALIGGFKLLVAVK